MHAIRNGRSAVQHSMQRQCRGTLIWLTGQQCRLPDQAARHWQPELFEFASCTHYAQAIMIFGVQSNFDKFGPFEHTPEDRASHCGGGFYIVWAPSQNPRILSRDVRAVVFVDVVDSVRKMATDEDATVHAWLDIEEAIIGHVLPNCQGKMIKSTGDGLLLQFDNVPAALEASFAIQDLCCKLNREKPESDQLQLRMGLEVGSIILGKHDIYGHKVNTAARLMTTIARPGDILITADAYAQITPDIDADVQDLGLCYLKGIEEPVRTYRARPPGAPTSVSWGASSGPLLPAIAIIPFNMRMSAAEHGLLGEVIADSMIRTMSRSQSLDVISRLSTTVFRGRAASASDIGQRLRANYIVSGTYRVASETVVLEIELADAATGRVIWSDQYRDKAISVAEGDTALVDPVVCDIHNAITRQELVRIRAKPFVTLESFTLMLGAITLMHRRSKKDFELARQLLEIVIEREPRHALPKAWLANWHVLRIQQGLNDSSNRERDEAVRCTQAALELDPDSSLALAIDGLVHTHMTKRHDMAQERYAEAVAKNPNDALAWLLKGTHHAFTGDGLRAVADTQRALRLSPLDPRGYYFHSLSASAYLAAGDNVRVLQHADISLKANRLNTSTLRAKAMAEWRLGKHSEARATGAELMRLEPNFSVSGWLRRSPAAPYDFGTGMAKTLADIGIPNT